MEILKRRISKTNSPEEKKKYEWSLELLNSKLNPLQINSADLQKYAGDYGPRKIYFENNQLIYERPGVLGRTKMFPITANYFTIEARDNFRVRFNLDGAGNVVSLTGVYSDGTEEDNKKIN